MPDFFHADEAAKKVENAADDKQYKEKQHLLVMNSVAKAIAAADAEKAERKAAKEALRAAKWY